ncbi:MAG: hypothetical protein IJN65_05655 [Clostridia bacterium]|nr:hypothetical protein [Clostridia bacterium]
MALIKWIKEHSHLKQKYIALTLLAVLIVSLIPLVVMAAYDSPHYDDYHYGLNTHSAWSETHNIFSVLKAAAQQTKHTYNTWQGSFSAVFLFTLQPALFGEQFYFIVPIIMLGALIFSCFYFCRQIFHHFLKVDNKWQILSVGCILSLLNIQLIESAAQGIYWYNGACYYTLFYAFFLIFIALIIKHLFKDGVNRVLSAVVLSVLGFIIGGGNYVTALVTGELLVLLIIYLIIKRKGNFELIIPVLFFAAAFIISIIAPGNSVRQLRVESMGATAAIIKSIKQALLYVINKFNVFELAAVLAAAPFLWRTAKQTSFKVRFPLVISAVSFLIFASLFTPTYYATSTIPGRVLNVVSFSYHLILLINLFIWFNWFAKRTVRNVGFNIDSGRLKFICEIEKGNALPVKPVSSTQSVLVFVFAALLIFGQVFPSRTPALIKTTSYSAAASIIRGDAKEYHHRQLERLELLKSGAEDIVFEPIKTKPYVLFIKDLSENADSGTNKALAKYYGIKTVVVKDTKNSEE